MRNTRETDALRRAGDPCSSLVWRRASAALALLILLASLSGACRTKLSHVRAVVRSAGSDTMVNVAQSWAEEYARVNPGVSVEVSGGGSATGIAALIDGVIDLANCSRRMQPSEIEAARRRTGGEVRESIVGYDALAVYVNSANPLDEITLAQLGRLYGENGDIVRWSQLGVSIPGARGDEIILISRQSNSGTYEYFRDAILGHGGDFRAGTRDLNGSKEVVALIANTAGAIGYSGMGYNQDGVKMLRVARTQGARAYSPDVVTTQTGEYPIARPLYIYSSAAARSSAVTEYLDWIHSAAGQRVVAAAGYVPLGWVEP